MLKLILKFAIKQLRSLVIHDNDIKSKCLSEKVKVSLLNHNHMYRRALLQGMLLQKSPFTRDSFWGKSILEYLDTNEKSNT
jgi:hypothetical protein